MKSNKKNLLVLTSTFPRYKGDATPPFVFELSRRLTDSFNVFVLAPFSKGAKKVEITNKMKIYRYKYWLNSGPLLTDRGAILPNISRNKYLLFQIPFFVFFQFVNVFKICRKEKIDIIHAHWIIPQGFAAVIYKKIFNPEIEVVITSHGGDIFGLQKLNFLKKWVIDNSSEVTVVSNAIKNQIKKLNPKKELKITVAPMGVDFSRFNPDNFDDNLKKKFNIKGPFLLFVGRLTEKKGVKYLILAMKNIVQYHPKTKLLIIGDGEERKNLEKLAKKNNLLNKAVIFVGAIKNSQLPKFYATADIFIGPSIKAENNDTEGFGLVFAEAIGSGCLTVASELPAVKDIVKNNFTGFLVKEKDPKNIAKVVINLIKNKDRYDNKFREQARDYVVSNFDWSLVSRKYERILNS
jgi:glycosyltransferase involved in cell wall biosynthesis